jgi:16S rRNA (guanine(966)-N(2))-methyltransferase RsmD
VRVISGEAKGHRLKTPADDSIRPTADKAKEALFHIIGERVPGALVLDLFAGTGNLGIEALSRGARRAFFVDVAQQAVATIRKNLALVAFTDRSTIWRADAFSALFRLRRMGHRFDLVFSDPPYGHQLAKRSLFSLARGQLVQENGLVIVEHHRKDLLPQRVATLLVLDERRFGDSMLTFYQQKVKP